MKRPIFLTIWLSILLIFSIGLTVDSLTYLPFISHTKSFISLLGIVAGFVQIWALIQLFRWKKIGVKFYIFSALIILLVTAFNEFTIVPKVDQVIASLLLVFVVNLVVLGILYIAMRPVWKNFQ